MNGRGFLSLFGKAAVGATVAYSFPSVIVPKNLGEVEVVSDLATINAITLKELYPSIIMDTWFQDTPFLAYLRNKAIDKLEGKEFIEPFKGETGFKFDRRLVME